MPCPPGPIEPFELILESAGPDHEVALHELATEPEVGATTTLPTPYPAEGAAQWIREAMRQRRAGTGFPFVVIVDGRVIGTCELREVGAEPRTAAVGYWIASAFRGRGHAAKALDRLVGIGFREHRLEEIRALCLGSNEAARRVLRRVGFALASSIERADLKWPPGVFLDLFVLTKNAWAGMQPS
jgi:8-oxo-dGTP diphosphatase